MEKLAGVIDGDMWMACAAGERALGAKDREGAMNDVGDRA